MPETSKRRHLYRLRRQVLLQSNLFSQKAKEGHNRACPRATETQTTNHNSKHPKRISKSELAFINPILYN